MGEVLNLAGGLAFFLYGMHLCAEALKSGSNRSIQRVIEKMVHGRIRGTFFGIGVTMLTQSSSATSVIALSMVNTALLTLAESAPILLGGAIGTSFTVQLISFRIAEYALIPVFFGIILILFSGNERWKLTGSVFLGFGLIFFGMEMMSLAVEPLISNPVVPDAIDWLADRPILAFLSVTVFTAIIQSSGAMIGLLISLSVAGGGHSPQALLDVMFPMILGANVGTCVTAFLAGIGTRREARRVALLQLVLRLVAVILVWPISGLFVDVILLVSGPDAQRAIANAHTLFNVAATIALLPFCGVLTGFARRLMPAKGDDNDYVSVSLDDNLASAPALALDGVQRELVRMAGLTEQQVRDTILAFFGGGNGRIWQQIEHGDGRIDRMYLAISEYINRVLGQRTTRAIRTIGERQFVCAASLESIADIAVKNILPLAKKYARIGEPFSQTGQNEIMDLHAKVVDALVHLRDALVSPEHADWQALITECEEISQLVDTMRLHHLGRLVSGERGSSETSVIHLDLIESLRRMENGIKHIAGLHTAQEEAD